MEIEKDTVDFNIIPVFIKEDLLYRVFELFFLLVVRKPVKIIPNFRGCRFYTIIPKVNSCPRRILRIWFTEPRVVWLWLCLFVVNIFISWTASEKRAYPCFIKSGIFSILVSKNKLLVGAAGGPKFTIWSAFSGSFKSF